MPRIAIAGFQRETNTFAPNAATLRDFESISAAVLNVAAPGSFPCALTATGYRKLREGVPLGSQGPVRE